MGGGQNNAPSSLESISKLIADILSHIQELESKLDYGLIAACDSKSVLADEESLSLRGTSERSKEASYNVGNLEIMDCHESANTDSHNDLNSLLESLPIPPTQGWEMVKISQIAEKISAGGDKPKVFSESKTKECHIPIYANAIENQGLYGYTNRATILENALTISARGTIGYAVARFEPFYPIVRLIVFIPKTKKANLKFLELLINNTEVQNSGVNIPQLTVPEFSNTKIPLPPLEAQEKIVKVIEIIESKITHLDSSLESLEKQKATILRKALNDEKPTATLL